MRILSYEYQDLEPTKWKFSKIDLGMLNLVVGDSGSGKTRFLNTLFNLGRNVVGKPKHLFIGHWTIRLEQNGSIYKWEVSIDSSKIGNLVRKEILVDETNPQGVPIVDRSERQFLFNGKELPQLSRESTSIELLQDEDVIRPLYNGFYMILRRDFSKDGLRKYISYEVASKNLLEQGVHFF